MSKLKGVRIAVVGGGVFGLMTAIAAARRGAEVRLHEPAPTGHNASAIAAGMLSPAFEALESGSDPGLFAILNQGLDAWRALGAPWVDGDALGSGAIYAGFGDAQDISDVADALETLGIEHRILSGEAARALQPSLSRRVSSALIVPMEGRVDPAQCLPAMARELHQLGGRILPEAVPVGVGFELWRKQADAVVIAAGYASAAWAGQAPALVGLQPIKGHILHFSGGPKAGPVVRNGEDYVAPQRGGAVFGATMQTDCADVGIEPEQVQALHARAVELIPGLAEIPFSARAGVRAATRDGSPLAGALGGGLFAATGARRNGWLLAPLVAETAVAAIAGEAAPHAAAFDPLRFG